MLEGLREAKCKLFKSLMVSIIAVSVRGEVVLFVVACKEWAER